MPDYVDRIVVVDDDSRDGTVETVRDYVPQMGEWLRLIQHETSRLTDSVQEWNKRCQLLWN